MIDLDEYWAQWERARDASPYRNPNEPTEEQLEAEYSRWCRQRFPLAWPYSELGAFMEHIRQQRFAEARGRAKRGP